MASYYLLELVGTSLVSFADATRRAMHVAARAYARMSWVEIVEERGRLIDGRTPEFQVRVKIAVPNAEA